MARDGAEQMEVWGVLQSVERFEVVLEPTEIESVEELDDIQLWGTPSFE